MFSLMMTLAITAAAPAPKSVAQVQTCVWPHVCVAPVAQVQTCVWPHVCVEPVAQVQTCVWPHVCKSDI
jgi:hypothetical protein